MTDSIKGNYWQFYLKGRGEKRLLKNDIDVGELAKQIIGSGGLLRQTLSEATAAAGKPLEVGKAKRKWLDEHADAIKDLKAIPDVAYSAWCQGRMDE